jgi:hypothetical protein
MAVFTLNAGTPLVHTTSSKDFELDPSKAIWLSAVGAQGLGVQNFGGGKKIYFRPSRDLDLFFFHESGPELQADKKGLIDLVKEGIGSGTLPASAITDAEEALKNALNADGTKWNSNRYVDRDLVDAISASFDLLGIDGWVRDFGNNREFLILQRRAMQTFCAKLPVYDREVSTDLSSEQQYFQQCCLNPCEDLNK